MLLIACPHCGERAQAEFAYERSLDSIAPVAAPPAEAMARLYARENPRGWADELWRHTAGCGAWMVLRRHRISHAIESVTPVGPEGLA